MSENARESSPYAHVDQMPPDVSAVLIDSLRQMAANAEIQRVRAVALDLLGPAPGQRLLDAGAGAGEVARQLARLVTPGGSVVALDRSATATAAGLAAQDGSPVEYRTGDITALDFPDGEFDGVRSERVLQHLPDADAAIRELIRVTRPGGRICLVDTDWESLAFDGLPGELVARVRAHFLGRLAGYQQTTGRTLRKRLVRAGLTDIGAVPVPVLLDTPATAAAVLPFLNRQVPAEVGLLPPDAHEAWFAEIDAAGARGEFLTVFTMWAVAGSKPADTAM